MLSLCNGTKGSSRDRRRKVSIGGSSMRICRSAGFTTQISMRGPISRAIACLLMLVLRTSLTSGSLESLGDLEQSPR